MCHILLEMVISEPLITVNSSDFGNRIVRRYNAECQVLHLTSNILKCSQGGLLRNPRQYKPGERVPAAGIYRVSHSLHRLMHEATLLPGTTFPCCKRCGDAVRFGLLRRVDATNIVPFRSGEILEEFTRKRSLAATGSGD